MEFTKVSGKRDNSEIYHVNDINKIYIRNKTAKDIVYLKCYFNPKCDARGTIRNNLFYVDNIKCSHSDPMDINQQLTYFTFWNALKDETTKTSKSNKILFDEIYMK